MPPAFHPSRPRPRPALRGALDSRFAALAALLVALAWALGEWVGERSLPTLLLAYLPPTLWVVLTLPALAYTLVRRRGWAWALLGTLIAVQGAGLLHGALPTGALTHRALRGWGSGEALAAPSLKVVTYNLARGTRAGGTQLGRALAGERADVLLLQETNFLRPGDWEALRAALPGYRAEQGHEVATLTRLPVLATRAHPLPRTPRTVLETRVLWQGHELRVLNAHLNTVLLSSALRGDWARIRRTNTTRAEQVQELCRLAAADGQGGRLLLGGDLNTPPRGTFYRRLGQCFGQSAYARAGRGPGWTFPSLVLRIDHQLARGLRPTRADVLPWPWSDHRPLRAEWVPELGEGH